MVFAYANSGNVPVGKVHYFVNFTFVRFNAIFDLSEE